MRAVSTMGVASTAGVLTGCLYGLRARSLHPADQTEHVLGVLTDPRPWTFVLLPTLVLLATWRGRWHGRPEVLQRLGGHRQQVLASFRECAGGSTLAVLGLLTGSTASGTGLPLKAAAREVAAGGMLLGVLIATTTLTALLAASVTHRSTKGGLILGGALVLWAICEVGLPTLTPTGGPVTWGFPDTRQEASIRELLPIVVFCGLWAVLLGPRWWRRHSDVVVLLASSTLWTAAAPRLLATVPADAGEQLTMTWWGHGQGQFDPLVYTAHWLVTSLPLLLVVNTWDRPWLQQLPLRVMAHGSAAPLVITGVVNALLLSGSGALASVCTVLGTHGTITPSGVLTAADFTAGWLVHSAFWGTAALAATWWSGNSVAGQLCVLVPFLLAPLAPRGSTGMPFDLAALGQGSVFSPALLWLLPATLGMALVLRHSPVPGQGRDL